MLVVWGEDSRSLRELIVPCLSVSSSTERELSGLLSVSSSSCVEDRAASAPSFASLSACSLSREAGSGMPVWDFIQDITRDVKLLFILIMLRIDFIVFSSSEMLSITSPRSGASPLKMAFKIHLVCSESVMIERKVMPSSL